MQGEKTLQGNRANLAKTNFTTLYPNFRRKLCKLGHKY